MWFMNGLYLTRERLPKPLRGGQDSHILREAKLTRGRRPIVLQRTDAEVSAGRTPCEAEVSTLGIHYRYFHKRMLVNFAGALLPCKNDRRDVSRFTSFLIDDVSHLIRYYGFNVCSHDRSRTAKKSCVFWYLFLSLKGRKKVGEREVVSWQLNKQATRTALLRIARFYKHDPFTK